MAEEMKELKNRSIRCSDEVMENLKMISKEVGGNMQDALLQLMNAYEMQKAMQSPVLKNQENLIRKYQEHSSVLQNIFLSVLEEMATMEDTVKVTYERQLTSSAERILQLEEQMKANAAKLEQANRSYEEERKNHVLLKNTSERELASLRELLEKEKEAHQNDIAHLSGKIEDKNEILRLKMNQLELLQSEYDNLKEMSRKMKKELEEADNLRDAITALTEEKKQLEQEREKLKKDHERELLNLRSELTLEKAKDLIDLEVRIREEMREKYEKTQHELQERLAQMVIRFTESKREEPKENLNNE